MMEAERARTVEDWRSNPIWRRIAMMRIEAEGAPLTFAARLARENGWSGRHAAAVAEEYRRFLYLAATAGPVTPSEDVDQAWHLHLSYTRHYWDVLCGEIIGRPLHHDPTGGGPAERTLYRRQYNETLAHYRAAFGAPPPRDIWPDAEARFAARPIRIDASQYWLVPKARTRRLPLLAGAAGLLAACTALAGNGASEGGSSSWPWILIIVLALTTAGFLAARAINRRDRRGDEGGCGAGGAGGGCSSNGHHSDGGSGCGSGCGGGCGGS